MNYDYTTNSHYVTYTFSLKKVGRMHFLSGWILRHDGDRSNEVPLYNSIRETKGYVTSGFEL